MNQNRAAKTRKQAVIKLAKMMHLELAGAICSDYKLTFRRRLTLEQTYTYFESLDIQEGLLVAKILRHFIQYGEYAQNIHS